MIEFWTDERISDLRRLWADGDSASIIGATLGATRNAILGKVHRLGLSSRMPIRSITDNISEGEDYNSVFKSREKKPRRESKPAAPRVLHIVSVRTGAIVNKMVSNKAHQEYTKPQLRAMLTQAVLNTAGMK